MKLEVFRDPRKPKIILIILLKRKNLGENKIFQFFCTIAEKL